MFALLALMLGCAGCQPADGPTGDGPADDSPPGDSPADDSPPGDSDPQDSDPVIAPGCDGPAPSAELTIDSTWSLVAPPEAWALAEHLAAGDLMMGCEDELPPMPVVEAAEGSAILLRLDESLGAQAYEVAYDAEHICITGGDARGLQYGALDWLASLERVELEGGGAWHPDPSGGEGPAVCSDYDAACEEDEACWSEGAWTPVSALSWTPQAVRNAPQVPMRLAFAGFSGAYSSNFLPNLLYAGLGRCEAPEDSAPFWAATLGCDPMDDGGACSEVRLRLDTLLAGRFTHALDDGHAVHVDDSVLEETGCDGARLQAELIAWLAERQVQLIPTVYGLETRAASTPVSGPRVDEEEPIEGWGLEGDASLSQGIGLERSFVACALDSGVFLAPDDCSQLDETGHVVGPLLVSATYDVDALTPPTSVSSCGPLELCATRSGCWDEVEGPDGLALSPAADCTNPVLRWILPDDGRWYALHFKASLHASRDLIVKLVTRDVAGLTNTAEFEVLSTAAEDNHYLHPAPGLQEGDPGWVRYSLVFRAPEAHARLDEAYLQLVGVPGSGALVDELFLAELEGQLRDVDAASLRGLDCAVIHDAAPSPLPVLPFFDHEAGEVLGGAAIQADCLSPGDTLTLRYRSWVHFGLWPGLATRQKTFTFSPGVYDAAFWAHPTSPTAQLAAYGDSDDASDWVLLSDLGGEARGLDRLGPLSETSAADTLASFVCQVEAEACEGCGACEASLLPLDDAAFAPCACEDWPTEPGPRLLLAGDMFTPLHNGGDGEELPLRGGYQVPHGGEWGDAWSARESVPSDVAFLAWWHFDTRRSGAAVGDVALGFAKDLGGAGFDLIGASAWDPDNQRAWAALAAGAGRSHTLPVIGAAQYGWGNDAQGARVMRNAGRLFWNPGWAFVEGWLMSTDPALPGGDETGQWAATGFAMEDSAVELSWPQAGTWLVVEGAEARWTSEAVAVEGERVLARWRGALPEGCSVEAVFSFDDVDATGVTENVLPEVFDYRAWSASAARPAGASAVAVTLVFSGCAGGTLDSLSVYDSLPVVDFPTAFEGEHLDDWDSAEGGDARSKICGDGAVGDCVNLGSWE